MKYLIVIFCFFVFISGFSQVQNSKEDVKVGLVLSGGGAKGLAHIGVLKVIDSLGIRIDYIAGTSMGAIVGSLYAAGYSGNQIDTIFRGVDFDKIISDNLPRAAKTFYERDNAERYAITLPFDKFKLKLPSALSRGQNTLSLLSKLTLHVSDVEDFSKLPIPFFCIATNVETGKAVVLDKGSLAQSVVASGAFPSLFQPVIIDNQILIDGGVVNNYPIDELKAKGMDIIIGVDVQDGLASRDELRSATAIILQINNYRTINDMKQKAEKTDIYIKPDITDYTVVSFSDGKKIIENGILAANKETDQLQKIVDQQIKKPKPLESIKSIDTIRINNINISGNEKYTRSYVLGKLKLKPEENIDYTTFVEGVNNLAATNNFNSVVYQLRPTKNEREYDLDVKVLETPTRTFFKVGLHYDDLYKTGVLLNLTRKRLLFNDDVGSLDFVLGDNIRYNFDYYIDKGFYWSVGLTSRYNQFKKNVPAAALLSDESSMNLNVNKLDVEVSDFTNQLYAQTLLGNDYALTLGAEHKRFKVTSETILTNANTKETTFDNSDYLSVYGRLKLDTYDNKYFPNEGFYFNGDFHLYLYSSNYNNNFSEFSIGKATMGYTKSFGKFSANITTQGGFKIGEDSSPYLDFVLGGYGNNLINNFTSFYGYDYLSIRGNSFVKGMITADYEIFKKHHIVASANLANVDDDIFDSGEWFTSPDYTGYALGYSIETFIGPIEAKYTWSPEVKKSIWFFNLGFWF
ncbi:patatin-like phospholipase family protein [Bizionia myxarmorum]|uniref:patatin-like phospholipase family protein n=1 Tax=Bizionia myxarmorum TaxID=291186 RepID=UPI00147932FD|nr:patatin-like phospholipase family protein [Bizionia myxarmorum]